MASADPSMKFVMASGLKDDLSRSVVRSGLRVRGGQLLGSRGSSLVVLVVENLDVMVKKVKSCVGVKVSEQIFWERSTDGFCLMRHGQFGGSFYCM